MFILDFVLTELLSFAVYAVALVLALQFVWNAAKRTMPLLGFVFNIVEDLVGKMWAEFGGRIKFGQDEAPARPELQLPLPPPSLDRLAEEQGSK